MAEDNTSTWKRRWELIDYAWLGIAALSLIPLANDLSRIINQNELNLLVNQDWYRSFENNFETSISAHDGLTESEAEVRWLTEALEAYQQSTALLSEAQRLIRNEDGEGALPKLIEARSILDLFLTAHPTEHLDPAVVQEFVGYFGLIQRAISELETEYLGTRVGVTEDALTFYTPVLLAIALGMRFAKVSAKVFVSA